MILRDLSSIFGNITRWVIAAVLGWLAYVVGSLVYLNQEMSVYLVWNSLTEVVRIVTMLMVLAAVQRLLKGEFKVSDQ